jgi:hypothetical protein
MDKPERMGILFFKGGYGDAKAIGPNYHCINRR